jgi:ankyrin repeat protein
MDTPTPSLETYQYTSLRHGDPTFRLLKLLKHQGPELKCELFPQSLSNDKHVSYEALSYVWGSSELVECIILDRKRLWITDNLYSALHCLRLHDRDRYLWIDAICINQADKEEQSWQVQQMGKIYGSAEGVLFWLGKATLEIMSLMDTLNQYPDGLLGRLTLDDNRWDDCRTGLRQLLGRQWFTRVWILQEVANARKATVYCGTRSVPAEIFACAPSVIREEPEPHCQAVLDIMPGPSRSGSWWGQKRDLCTLLRRFQASKATDERDKIYALLGMSSDPLDTQSIDIDYKRPTHHVIHQAVTHLLHTTRLSVHEILNLMYHFETLETTCFVLPFGQEEATDILFPHLQSGNALNVPLMPEEPNFMYQGIPVVDDPALLLFEKRLERNFKEDETCHSQVVRLILGGQTNESRERERYDKGLRVISWGSPEHRVKIVVIHDRGKAILQAALQGCAHVVKHLLHLKVGIEEGGKLEEEVLREAIHGDHTLAVQTILHQTTHVHVQGRRYDNALRTAAHRGNEQVVKLLLDKGADVNALGGDFGNALGAAAFGGSKEIVKLLLDKGANVNALGGKYGNALGVAALRGSTEIVELLLDKGANVNALSGNYGNALGAAAAASRGSKEIVELLLDNGANVNALVGKYGYALGTAALAGSKEIVELLLDKGADVNALGGYYGNALGAAAYRGRKEIVKLLLDKGANIHKQGGHYGNALGAAACGGSKEMVELLLDKGANIHKQGGFYGNALGAAAYGGRKEIVELLLEKGAHIHKQGGNYGNALGAAAYGGRKEIVELLLEKGAHIHKQGGHYGNALGAAACGGSKEMVELLLDKGATIHKQGGFYGNALGAAACGGSKEMVELLLDKGANIHKHGGFYGNALGAAAYGGRKEIVELLLDKGADIHKQGGNYGNALGAAVCGGMKEIVELLLDKGANNNAPDHIGRTPLLLAAENGNEAIVFSLMKQLRNTSQKPENTQLLLSQIVADELIGVESLLIKEKDELNPLTTEHMCTLLLWAAQRGHKSVVTLLLQKEAVDPDTKDMFGMSPLLWAAANGHEAVVRLLLATDRVDTNSADTHIEHGQTPLAWAAKKGHEAVVRTLLATNSVNVKWVDNRGRMPQDLAQEEGHDAVLRLLYSRF